METSRLIPTQGLNPRSHHPQHPHSQIGPRQSLHRTQRVLPRSVSIGLLRSHPRKLAEFVEMSIYAFRILALAGVQAPGVAAVEARGSAVSWHIKFPDHVPAIIQKLAMLVQAPIAQFVRFSQHPLGDPAALTVVVVFQALARWSRPCAYDGFLFHPDQAVVAIPAIGPAGIRREIAIQIIAEGLIDGWEKQPAVPGNG